MVITKHYISQNYNYYILITLMPSEVEVCPKYLNLKYTFLYRKHWCAISRFTTSLVQHRCHVLVATCLNESL